MTQPPEDKGEKPQLKVSSLNKKDQTMSGGIRQYATLGGVLIIIILLAVIIFRGGQSPQTAAPSGSGAARPARIARYRTALTCDFAAVPGPLPTRGCRPR